MGRVYLDFSRGSSAEIVVGKEIRDAQSLLWWLVLGGGVSTLALGWGLGLGHFCHARAEPREVCGRELAVLVEFRHVEWRSDGLKIAHNVLGHAGLLAIEGYGGNLPTGRRKLASDSAM